MDNMKKGIPANETRFTPKAERNKIVYTFVNTDSNTPSGCTVRLGDIDPKTGEELTDIEFFASYYREVDKEIHHNLNCMRPEYTDEEKARRLQEALTYRKAFREKYGYAPSRDDVRYHLEQLEKDRYNLYYDGLCNEQGESLTDHIPEFGRCDSDPFDTEIPEDVRKLREFAESLTGRKKAVYQAMLDNLAGGSGKDTNAELARRWGVRESEIRKDQLLIIKMIREYFRPHRVPNISWPAGV